MKIERDGSLIPHTAFEAEVFGLEAAFGSETGERQFFSHRIGQLAVTLDEVEFAARFLEYGDIVIPARIGKRIIAGLTNDEVPRLHESGHKPRVPHQIASSFMEVIRRQQGNPEPPGKHVAAA